MTIGLVDLDNSGFPNIALGKISAYHKSKGDTVSWASPLFRDTYDIVYKSQVFSFSQDFYHYPNEIKGGSGYSIESRLPLEIDRLQPDLSIYGISGISYGFLTRGCTNKCPWCIVPKKEGSIYAYMDIDEVMGENKKAVLMDNNILASSYGVEQIQNIIKKDYKVDFNQGLDTRLIDFEMAKLLSKVKWLNYIRIACDTPQMLERALEVKRLFDKVGYHREIMVYALLRGDIEECVIRVKTLQKAGFCVHAQPSLSLAKDAYKVVPQWQKDLARYCNHHAISKKCSLEDYSPRRGFKFSEYLK